MADDGFDWENMMMDVEDAAAMGDGIEAADEVSLSSKLNKSPDEIDRYTVDENFSESERLVWILKHGYTIQKCSVISSGIVRMLAESTDEFQKTVLPVILERVAGEPVAFQKACAKFFLDCGIQFVTGKMLQTLLGVSKKLLDSKDHTVSELWAEVYLQSIQYIPAETILGQVLPEALIDGGLAQPAPIRIWCGRVLGAVSTRLDSKKIEDLYLHKALALCQDTDYDVRRSMCNQLQMIAKALGPKIAKEYLIPEYVELLVDEEPVVRNAAVESLVSLLDFFDPETRSSTLIPMWKKLADDKSPQSVLLIAKHFGQFLWQTKNELSDVDKRYFLAIYQSMCVSDSTEVLEHCAHNFPAVVLVYKPTSFDQLKLEKLLDLMATHESPTVRRKIAAGFHELAALLKTHSFKALKETYVKILRSNDEQSLMYIFGNFETLLKHFVSDESVKSGYDLLLGSLVQLERDAQTECSQWRLRLSIIKAFGLLPDFIDTDRVYEECVPVLIRALGDNVPVPVKTKIIEILVSWLKKLKRIEYREGLLKQLIELREERSYQQRILFLDICENVLSKFSKKFFREHFFHHYLVFSRDAVPNVRLRFVGLLPTVRKTLRVPQDTQYVQKLIDSIEPLITKDGASDVMAAVNHLLAKYGPLDGNFSFKNNQEDLFGIDFQPRQSVVQRSPSSASLTDSYLFHNEEKLELCNDKTDKQREEEEQKLAFEPSAPDWNMKRRELHDQRQEFHRKFGDVGKKPGQQSARKPTEIPPIKTKGKRERTVGLTTLADKKEQGSSQIPLPGSAGRRPSVTPKLKDRHDDGESQSPLTPHFANNSITNSEIKQLEADLLSASVSKQSSVVQLPKVPTKPTKPKQMDKQADK
ncbi:armadillo-type protein [Gorgonomyces haynaldii]|nr:armadillo-type protein [Gorgonomyces haynaldii]